MLHQIHTIMAIATTSILAITALVAILLTIQTYALHQLQRRKWIPSVQTMLQLLFVLAWISFILLSLTLISAFLVPGQDFSGKLLAKTFFSIAAWCLFATLLYGRIKFGWQNSTSIKFIAIGSILLIFAYVGSKLWNISL